MSFYFDDDNDDNALSQVFQTSSQKQVTFSQSLSQTPTKQSLSQQLGSPSQPFSQKSILSSISNASKQTNHNAEKSFVCQNCGAVDQCYKEHGLVTCSKCFTQSQDFGALQEELDYEESQHMAARNRDGTLKRVTNKRQRATNPDGSFKVGRPATPLEQLDSSKKFPPLDACLRGFQSVLQKSCKILCLELLPTLKRSTQGASSNDSDSDESDAKIHPNYCTQEQKKELHRQVSKTVRKMWKAFLLSWKEGADYYSNLYPQMRFALRDQFLLPKQRAMLYQTLAARAEEKLTQEIRQKVKEEEKHESDHENQSSDSDSDSDDDSYFNRRSKKMKMEDGQDDNTAEVDSLYNLDGHNDHDEKKIKSENVVSEDEIPIPDLILSNEPQTAITGHSRVSTHHYHSRHRLPWNAPTENENDDFIKQLDGDESDSDNENAEANDNFSIASDLSIGDAAEYKRKHMASRKRKRTKQREMRFANSSNPYAKMIYFHNRIMHQKSKSKKVPKLGRKEAALLIKPSMELILIILLVAASPHGLTEGKLAAWVGNGSLPILDAFRRLLSANQQRELSMIASFFTIPKAPDAGVLKFLTRKVHVACGYRAPKVKLMRRYNRRTKGRTMTEKSLVVAGRLVRPSSVPMMLGYLVSELGLSQKVLNYSLALMGLPVSIWALKAAETIEPRGKGRPRQDFTHIDITEDWDSEAIPEFDLSKASDRQERRRYLNKLAQRRRRAKQRKKLGLTVHTIYRNKKYQDTKLRYSDTLAEIPDFISSGRNENVEDEVPDFVSSQGNHKNAPAVDKEKTEWLPPALRKARPDKLSDIDQILAVVIVACKLIPGWETNHHYVFSRGIGSTSSEQETEDKAKDRFVPWNHKEFCRIVNGKTESDYLDFLKECIFRGDRYALPKFVESLSKSSSDFDDHGENEGIKEEESVDEHRSDTSLQPGMNTVVKPNDVVLDWKKNPSFENVNPTPIRDSLGQIRVPYRQTKYADTTSVKRPAGPLGVLIEYMAYKTGTCPVRILNQLLVLDEELASKGKPESQTFTLPPNVCYEHFMGKTNTTKATTKLTTERTQRKESTLLSYSTPVNWNQDMDNLFLAAPATENVDDENDNILTERVAENDDVNSVGSVWEV